MTWLKIYDWEHERYPKFQEIIVTEAQAKKYVKKLARHFKTPEPLVMAGNKTRGGLYWRGLYYAKDGKGRDGNIVLSDETSLGVVIHEFAHHLAWKRVKAKGHRKEFKRELKRAYTWAKRYLPKPESDTPVKEYIAGTTQEEYRDAV